MTIIEWKALSDRTEFKSNSGSNRRGSTVL